jgi:serine/threonine protein kinase
MFSGCLPFKGKDQDETFELVKKGEYEMLPEIPLSAQDLINQLLVINPDLRIGAHDINDLCNHDFFKGIRFETIKDQEPPSCERISFKLS